MADRDLEHARNCREEVAQVVEIEVVAGVDAESLFLRGAGGCGKGGQRASLLGRAMGARVGFGVELDAIGSDGPRRAHRSRIGIHEQADADAERARFGDQRRKPGRIAVEVPAMVRGRLLGAVGDEGALLRLCLANDLHQVVKGIALDVELGASPSASRRDRTRRGSGYVAGPDADAP